MTTTNTVDTTKTNAPVLPPHDAKPPKGRRDFDRANASRGTETIKLPLSMIKVRPGFNPRDLEKPTTQAKIKSLVESYKAGDYVRPIEVAFAKTHYEIVDGECRFTAANLADKEMRDAGGKGIEAFEVYPLNDVDEADRLIITINGNQGETLTPMEMADVVDRLKGMGLERKQIAERLHKTIGWIDRLIVLGKIHQDIRSLVNRDKIAMDVVVKIYQGDKSEGKLDARNEVLALVDHYKDRVEEAAEAADPDALANGEGSGVKITMRDYLDYLAAKDGGRRDGDKPKAKDTGSEGGEGEGEGEGEGGDSKPKEAKTDTKGYRLGLARELAFAMPDDIGFKKSQIRKTQTYSIELPGEALLMLLKLQDEFVGEAEAEQKEREAKEEARAQKEREAQEKKDKAEAEKKAKADAKAKREQEAAMKKQQAEADKKAKADAAAAKKAAAAKPKAAAKGKAKSKGKSK